MRLLLAANAEGIVRINRARERKEEELSGIEKQVAVTERKMARERKVGETLLSRQEDERRRLAGIEREKKRKEKELKSLRARIARMESVVSRVERQVKERERLARKRAAGAAGRTAGREPAETPRRFASLSGGLSAPLSGKVVTRFGRQHDPTFDVTIENRGVEIEAPSGASVKSVGQGEVAFAGAVSGFGNVLIVQHGGGLFSVYGRMETFLAKQGEAVKKGTVVGRLPESPSGKSVLYLELRAGAPPSIRRPPSHSTGKEPITAWNQQEPHPGKRREEVAGKPSSSSRCSSEGSWWATSRPPGMRRRPTWRTAN